MDENVALLLKAIREAQAELARYVEPGEHNAEQTINNLLGILDTKQVIKAMGKLEVVDVDVD